MITCSWCKTGFGSFTTNCARCGGPLPPPPGEDAGPPPPPAPRELPPGYRRLMMWEAARTGLAGMAALAAVSVFVFLVVRRHLNPFNPADSRLLIVGPLAGIALLGSFFALGIGLASYSAHVRLRTLQHGAVALGKITKIMMAPKKQEDDATLWLISYAFSVQGAPWEGMVECEDASRAQYLDGQAVHVLYMPDAPAINILYPPAD